MKVGSIEESVSVTAETPIVDVQNVAHTTVLSRDVVDTIPTSHTIQGVGQLVVGINLDLPDTAGARAMQQTYMSTHGQSAANTTVMVDGMMVNGLMSDGAVQMYFNDQMSAEFSYQTSGIGAETSAGGVRLNMIPREGGNRFSGSFNMSYRPGAWQADNLSDRLKAGHPEFVPAVTGLTTGNATDRIADFSIAQGGPIARNKLWFFLSARHFSVNNFIANAFYVPKGATILDCANGRASCDRGIDDQYIRDALGRLTWQVSPKVKFAGYFDEVDKFRGHDMQSLTDAGTAATVWYSPAYHTAQMKMTATLSNKWMLDGGWSTNLEYYTNSYLPGIEKPRGSPEWLSSATRSELDLGGRIGAPSLQLTNSPARYNVQAALSYITGSHNFKAGFQDTWGTFRHTTDLNADLAQQYRSNSTGIPFSVPSSVVIRNTPVDPQENLNYDFGAFVQDRWTTKRLTVTAGVRWEALNAEVVAADAPAGRFVPARHFDAVPNVPNWRDWAPRVSANYDLFGNAKTALKFSLNRYNQQRTTGVADNYNPMVLATSTSLTWNDKNRDDIAQGARNCAFATDPGCEINFSALPANFGTAALNRYGDYPRTWNLESGLELQHELLPRLSVSGAWFHGAFHNLTTTYLTEWSYADYTPIQIFNPIDGTPITVYNRSTAANSRAADILDTYDPERQRIYNSYSFEFRARPRARATIFGGVSIERELNVNCTQPDNPNSLRFCDDRENGIPFRKNLRLAATYPLPWGISASASFQSNRGVAIGTATSGSVSYAVTAATRYPSNCPSPCPAGALVTGPALTVNTVTVPLVPYLQRTADRINQLDLQFSKTIQAGRFRFSPTLEIFNATNPDQIVSYVSTSYATSSYLRPNSIVQGRIIGVSVKSGW
jgi:hypothetical protein